MLGRVKVLEPVCSCKRRAAVRHAIADHGANDAQIVRMLGDIRKQIADLDAALPVLPELPGRLQQVPDAVFGERQRPLKRQRLAMILRQPRLGIEGVHVRRTAVHEQEDHALGPRRENAAAWAPADRTG